MFLLYRTCDIALNIDTTNMHFKKKFLYLLFLLQDWLLKQNIKHVNNDITITPTKKISACFTIFFVVECIVF